MSNPKYETITENPCPYCGSPEQHLEVSKYTEDATFIRDPDARLDWLVICPECGTRTTNAFTKQDAIDKWNRQEFTHMSNVLNKPGYHPDTTLWTYGDKDHRGLAKAIIDAQFDDLKAEIIAHMKKGEPITKLNKADWFYTDGFQRFGSTSGDEIVKAAKKQAVYDIWRDKHHCESCAINEDKCPHKRGYIWIQFTSGKDRRCRRE